MLLYKGGKKVGLKIVIRSCRKVEQAEFAAGRGFLQSTHWYKYTGMYNDIYKYQWYQRVVPILTNNTCKKYEWCSRISAWDWYQCVLLMLQNSPHWQKLKAQPWRVFWKQQYSNIPSIRNNTSHFPIWILSVRVTSDKLLKLYSSRELSAVGKSIQ